MTSIAVTGSALAERCLACASGQRSQPLQDSAKREPALRFPRARVSAACRCAVARARAASSRLQIEHVAGAPARDRQRPRRDPQGASRRSCARRFRPSTGASPRAAHARSHGTAIATIVEYRQVGKRRQHAPAPRRRPRRNTWAAQAPPVRRRDRRRARRVRRWTWHRAVSFQSSECASTRCPYHACCGKGGRSIDASSSRVSSRTWNSFAYPVSSE